MLVLTSVLFGKNQHITPIRTPNEIPMTSSIGPRNIVKTRLPDGKKEPLR